MVLSILVDFEDFVAFRLNCRCFEVFTNKMLENITILAENEDFLKFLNF